MNRKNYKKIVIKVGTSTLTHSTGKPNLDSINSLARLLSDINNSGIQVILVSSGAIAVGASKLGLSKKPDDVCGRQAAAAVGQCELMHIYDRAFADYNTKIAQVLLTKDIVDNCERKSNVINTFSKLVEFGVIPIVNENDSVAIDEVLFGDNDQLSALVAVLTKADLLILLSDIDGLYDCDPRINKNAKLIETVNEIDADIEKTAGHAGTNRGTGGMITKLEAGKMATGHGIDMAIANGKDPHVVYDILNGSGKFTLFTAKKSYSEE